MLKHIFTRYSIPKLYLILFLDFPLTINIESLFDVWGLIIHPLFFEELSWLWSKDLKKLLVSRVWLCGHHFMLMFPTWIKVQLPSSSLEQKVNNINSLLSSIFFVVKKSFKTFVKFCWTNNLKLQKDFYFKLIIYIRLSFCRYRKYWLFKLYDNILHRSIFYNLNAR